jgi:ferritin-like metal-binding protein YciE
MKAFEDLFLDSLADMYYAETHLVKALARLAKAATREDLRSAFESHRMETEGHVHKLEEIFATFGKPVRKKRCPAIIGIVKEADAIAAENKQLPTINASLIYAAQKAEHYEIASYGSLREWARRLNKESAGEIIDEILDEEKAADKHLTELARAHCNPTAEDDSGKRMAA